MKLLVNKQVNHVDVDAKNYSYGRLCSHVADLISEKHLLDRSFNDSKTVIKISNIDQVRFSHERKFKQMKFYRYSGYLGNLKVKTLGEYMEQGRLRECFLKSIRGMVRKTTFYRKRITKNIQFV